MVWMTAIWKGKANEVIAGLRQHQGAIGHSEIDSPDDLPTEQLRFVLQYLENKLDRLK